MVKEVKQEKERTSKKYKNFSKKIKNCVDNR